jgi:hypothetical protein
MALGPQGDAPRLTQQEIRLVAEIERELDAAIRREQPSSKIVFLSKPGATLGAGQIQLLEARYLNAGWRKVSIAETAGGAYVITLLL